MDTSVKVINRSLNNNYYYNQDIINNLPNEILQYIFSFALYNNPTNLPSLILTCKNWKIISTDSFFLKPLYKSYFVNEPALSEDNCSLTSIINLINNIKALITECRQIDSCKDLSIDNLSPDAILELKEKKDHLYNLEILYSEIKVGDIKDIHKKLKDSEKLKFITKQFQKKKRKHESQSFE